MYTVTTNPIERGDNTCGSCVFFKTQNVINGTGSYMGCKINHECWNSFSNAVNLCPRYILASVTICVQDGYIRTCNNE